MAEPLPSGPSKALEAIVGLFVPPACREEVMGDLHEKYRGTAQYILLVLQTVPCVIVSRIWRTTDARVLLMQTVLLYACYLAAAWYTNKAFLYGQYGLSRLAVPAVLAVAFMMIEDAWSAVREKSPWRLVGEVGLGTFLAFQCMEKSLPDALNLFGACASLVLVSTVRILFRPQFSRHQIAAGPVAPDEPTALGDITKGLLAALPVALAAIALVSLGFSPGMVGDLIFVVVFLIGMQFNKSRKE
jgi:hypothetical protein